MASEKPISVGDLVMVVRPKPCGCTNVISRIFTVEWVGNNGYMNECQNCKAIFPEAVTALFNRGYYLVSTLIRIDPPAIDETVRTEDEVTA